MSPIIVFRMSDTLCTTINEIYILIHALTQNEKNNVRMRICIGQKKPAAENKFPFIVYNDYKQEIWSEKAFIPNAPDAIISCIE